MRVGAAVVAFVKKVKRWARGYCLNFVRTSFDIPGGAPSAIAAWNRAKYRHGPHGTPPAGVPVFFRGGRYGHVAMSVGGGMCRSTDYPRAGVVSTVNIATLAKNWGYEYIGWTEDLNEKRIFTAPKPTKTKPVVAKVTALSAKTKVGKTAWQVSDLRYVLYRAGFLSKALATQSDVYDSNVQRAVEKFHASKTGHAYADKKPKQIGPGGWLALQRLAGRR